MPPLRILVELPSWPRAFLGNLRDLLRGRDSAPVELRSAPGEFWPDVFVRRGFGWGGVWRSCGCHAIAFLLLLGASRLLASRPRVIPQTAFDHSQVVYYRASEYLPALDTRRSAAEPSSQADPLISHQDIISLPREADNRSQTIVTPPKVKLNREAPMPNIVAWSDEAQKPKLAIPDAPLLPASEITRLAPALKENVVAPAPDTAHLQQQRTTPSLETKVVAPPPQINTATAGTQKGLQLDVIAPPPPVEAKDTRSLGPMNIGASAVIAPAPLLAVAAQRTLPRGGLGSAAQVVPPPPPVGAAGTSGTSAGARGRVIALNLHPAVGAPPDPSAGNRRGAFAAGPEGRAGASGAAGTNSSAAASSEGSGAAGKENSKLPAGLYVGNAKEATSTVAGDPTGKPAADAVNPDRGTSPRVTRTARPMQPADAAKLTEPERSVFGGRRFYSATLNMPNLNSAGGSWIIRFAELPHESSPAESATAAAPAADLTQPYATTKVDPAYPMQLMRENVAGTVILYAVIRADGTVGNLRVLRGVDDRLDRFASEALAKWKFDPARKNGAPVDVEATFQVPFRPSLALSNF